MAKVPAAAVEALQAAIGGKVSQPGQAGYDAAGGDDFAAGFDSCWLRTLTALARHFQQRGESCTKPSLKLTVVHSAVRSHQTQVASGCHWDRVTSMR